MRFWKSRFALIIIRRGGPNIDEIEPPQPPSEDGQSRRIAPAAALQLSILRLFAPSRLCARSSSFLAAAVPRSVTSVISCSGILVLQSKPLFAERKRSHQPCHALRVIRVIPDPDPGSKGSAVNTNLRKAVGLQKAVWFFHSPPPSFHPRPPERKRSHAPRVIIPAQAGIHLQHPACLHRLFHFPL